MYRRVIALNKPSNIYLVGICGIAMGTLACMLQEQGYTLSGSDENIYPPMSDVLRDKGIVLHKGFNQNNIKTPDLVIIGNAISRGNPEVEVVLNNKIPYMSMAEAIRKFFLEGKEVIAVCGTHGKTTTTSLLAHIFHEAGLDPSFFIGGLANNYNSNYRLGNGPYFIIEGDEYDSAFFEKLPKFIFYRPSHAVLTSLEFDHADIYNNIGEIELWFKRLINIIPSAGTIIYASQYANLAALIANSWSKTFSFGPANADYSYICTGYTEQGSLLTIQAPGDTIFHLETTLLGEFNFQNITAAFALAMSLGIDANDICQAIHSFSGVKRRQQLIFSNQNLKIYEDFAHHPTAIAYMLKTMKERYPEYTLWALYEPRSATSRRNTFQHELPGAFSPSDVVLIKTPFNLEKIPSSERIDINEVLATINQQHPNKARLFNSTEDMIEHVIANIDLSRQNSIVIMSNGGFDNIYKNLTERLGDM